MMFSTQCIGCFSYGSLSLTPLSLIVRRLIPLNEKSLSSELSPLGHTVHHMGRWVCQLNIQEEVDVLNMKTLQKLESRKRTAVEMAALAEKKAARVDAASPLLCLPC